MIHLTFISLFLCVASDVMPVKAASVDDRLNFFDVDLLEALTSDGDNNVVVSPASVKTALTTLVEGTAGRTAEEILTLLRLPSDPASIRIAAKRSLAPFKARRVGAELDLATRLWAGNNVAVVQKYRETLRDYYDGDVETVNFGDGPTSSRIINDWVYQQTRGHIDSIVTPGSLSAGTQLLLTNALYLKGTWKTAFNRNLTASRCFHVPKSGCQNTHLMQSLAYYRYAYIPSLNADVVEIPYSDGQLSMLIILPERAEDGINRVSRDLAHTPLRFIVDQLEETEILLSLPRFSVESKMDLRPTLEKLGVRDLFDLNANISGIIRGPVQIRSILHNAKIEVNEEGTVAAAVTAAAVVPLMGSTVQRFRADHPFIFIIREHEYGNILFAGRVTQPDLVVEEGSGSKFRTYVTRRLGPVEV